MSDMVLTQTRIRAGIWEGILIGPDKQPALEVWHQEKPVPGLVVTVLPDQAASWAVTLAIPAELLSEGVQTFVFREVGKDKTLAQFAIVTGLRADEDVRAELDLIRAELDLLKQAFRRHCVETAG